MSKTRLEDLVVIIYRSGGLTERIPRHIKQYSGLDLIAGSKLKKFSSWT
jgi:hypothetical protein